MGFAELARFKTEGEAMKYYCGLRRNTPELDDRRIQVFRESNGEWTVNLE